MKHPEKCCKFEINYQTEHKMSKKIRNFGNFKS